MPPDPFAQKEQNAAAANAELYLSERALRLTAEQAAAGQRDENRRLRDRLESKQLRIMKLTDDVSEAHQRAARAEAERGALRQVVSDLVRDNDRLRAESDARGQQLRNVAEIATDIIAHVQQP